MFAKVEAASESFVKNELSVRQRVVFSIFACAMLVFSEGDAFGDCSLEKTMPSEIYRLIGVISNDELAKKLEEVSAQGNRESQYLLASILSETAVTKDELAKAIELYAASASQGYFPAQMSYGLLLYEAGRFGEATPLLLDAAHCGARNKVPLALSRIYGEGLGVPVDIERSECWQAFAFKKPLDNSLAC